MKKKDSSLLFLFIFLLGCSNVSKKSDSNDSVHLMNSDPVIAKDNSEFSGVFSGVYAFDVNKKYPEKEISIQSIAEVEYIPMETRDDMLMRRRDTQYLDNNEIIATNGKDVMFFNRDGSALYSFNHSGGSSKEYSEISSLAYDKKNDEIFILDLIPKRIKVYSKKGEFKRSLSVSSPKGKHIWGLLSVDDNHLACFTPKEPIMLISKKDAHVVKILQTSFREALGSTYYKENKSMTASTPFYGRALNGSYILTDLSSDSTYLLTSNNELKLFSIRKPAIHDMEVPVFLLPCLETSNYYFVSTVKIEYDFEKNVGFPYEVLMYDKVDNKIYTQKFYNSDYTNKEYIEIEECFAILSPRQYLIGIRSDLLIDAYKDNKLKGKLKEIASKLKDEDNPVLMLITFK